MKSVLIPTLVVVLLSIGSAQEGVKESGGTGAGLGGGNAGGQQHDADVETVINARDKFTLSMGDKGFREHPLLFEVKRKPGDDFVTILSRDKSTARKVPFKIGDVVTFIPETGVTCAMGIDVFQLPVPDGDFATDRIGFTYDAKKDFIGYFGAISVQVVYRMDNPIVRQIIAATELERFEPATPAILLKERPRAGLDARPRIDMDPIGSPNFQKKIGEEDNDDIGVFVDTPSWTMSVGRALANPGKVGTTNVDKVDVAAGEKWRERRTYSTFWFADCTDGKSRGHVRVRWGYIAEYRVIGAEKKQGDTKGASRDEPAVPQLEAPPDLAPLDAAVKNGGVGEGAERYIKQP